MPPQPAETTLNQAYAAAIALNNIGVSLLERHCFTDAAAILRDAATVMKGVSETIQEQTSAFTPLNSRSEGVLPSPENLSNMIRNANSKSINSRGIAGAQVNIFVISEEESAYVASANMGDQTSFPMDITFLIKLEMRRCSLRDCETCDPVLEASVIMHNFGAAHRFMALNPRTTAQEVSSTEQIDDCYRAAYLLCDLAFSLMQEPSVRRRLQENENYCSHCLPVSILVLRSLISLSVLLGLPAEAELLYSELLSLQGEYLPCALVLEVSARNRGAAAA